MSSSDRPDDGRAEFGGVPPLPSMAERIGMQTGRAKRKLEQAMGEVKEKLAAAGRKLDSGVAASGLGGTGLAGMAGGRARTCPRNGCTELNPLDARFCRRCGVTLR